MSAPSLPRPKVGTVLDSDWVFHNTTPEAVAQIMREGMDAGSFAARPIDFGRKAWLAIRKTDLAPFETFQYGDVVAFEPTWEVWNADFTQKVRRTLDAGLLVRVNSRGRVVRTGCQR